jgi:hypothetical protein
MVGPSRFLCVAAALIAAGCGAAAPTAPAVVSSASTAPTLLCAIGSGDCSAAMEGESLTFTASRGALALRASSLDLGDGTVMDLGTLPTPATVTHTYAIGTFTARLLVTDMTGASQPAPAQTVHVGSLVTASVGAADLGGLNVTATADIRGAAVVRYEWNFDPSAAPVVTTEPQAWFTYAAPGYKAVVLKATLADGRVITASSSVVVA